MDMHARTHTAIRASLKKIPQLQVIFTMNAHTHAHTHTHTHTHTRSYPIRHQKQQRRDQSLSPRMQCMQTFRRVRMDQEKTTGWCR